MDVKTVSILSNYPNDSTNIDISDKGITGVLDLSGYQKLEVLDCCKNKINKIINVPKSLIRLNCSNNLIQLIDTSGFNRDFKYFNFANNPVVGMYYKLNLKIKKYSKKLKIVLFEDSFNQPVDNLPVGLEDLKFGVICEFNFTIDNLPNSIKRLGLNNRFNKPIDNLPDSLVELRLGDCFNHTVDNLPRNLKSIKFGSDFNKSINNLPDTIVHIEFDKKSIYDCNIDKLPCSIVNIKIPRTIKNFFLAEYHNIINHDYD